MQRIVVQEEMEPMDPVYKQDEDLLKPWINTHRLKKIEGVWYKDGRCVVMGKMEHKRLTSDSSYKPITTHQYTGILGLTKHTN